MSKLALLVFMMFVLLAGCRSQNEETPSPTVAEKKVEVYYTCSMHPHVREEKPGKCPICQMNLTRVTVEHDDHQAEVKADELYRCTDFPDVTSAKPDVCPLDGTPMVKVEVGQSAGSVIARVKLQEAQLDHFQSEVFPVTPMKMSKKLRVLGQVKSAEEKASNIAARFPARVEKVFVESVGSQIKKGDPVVTVYSPELLTAGEELILSARQAGGSAEFKQLFSQVKEKLLLWGIKPYQINRWLRMGELPRQVTIFAESSGVVRQRLAVPGKYFQEGQNYFELTDLSQVWVEMDVYEQDSNLIRPGQKVTLSFVAIPGQQEVGEVDFISPTIDEQTRTMKVRTTIANSEGNLKPGMVAQGTIAVELEGTPLVVPATAVIDTGVRKVVWVEENPEKYTARLVETGFRADGYVEVTAGLQEGEKVVIEGGFLLDAQAQFFGGYEDFTPAPEVRHDH